MRNGDVLRATLSAIHPLPQVFEIDIATAVEEKRRIEWSLGPAVLTTDFDQATTTYQIT